jgi:NNP family nitrate/nitrite transporter-like MFS transporter
VEKKWLILAIAVFAEVLAEAIWFSYAPFTGSISTEFGLGIARIGLLASASVWITPPGRIFSGVIADKYGAENVFSLFLLIIGVFSILSAFAGSYEVLFVTRIFAALGGVTVIVRLQQFSQ